jgi:hypothetical protein
MLQPNTVKLLEELKNTQYGKALKEFLDENMKEVGDITQIKSWEEAQGRLFALKVLENLFSFIVEKKITKDKPTNQYE